MKNMILSQEKWNYDQTIFCVSVYYILMVFERTRKKWVCAIEQVMKDFTESGFSIFILFSQKHKIHKKNFF